MIRRLINLLLPASTLKNRIFYILIVFTTIPFIIIAIYVNIYTNQRIIKEYSNNISTRLNECISLINVTVTNYIDKSSYIITSQYLIKNIQRDYSSDLEQMMYFSDIINVMIAESVSDNIKRPFIIYTYNKTLYEGKFIDRIDRIEGNELVNKTIKSSATEIIWDQKLTLKNNKKYLTFYRNIVGVDFKNSIGVLEVNIPYADIESVMDRIGMTEKGLIFSTNENGEVMHFNNQTSMEIKNISTITKKDYIIVSDKLRNEQKVTIAIPKREVYKKSLKTFVILLIIFLIYILVMLLASRITAQKITRSLESFINRIKQNNNLILNEELIQIKENDEVSIIKQKFKELVSRMNEIYKEMVNVKLENSSLEIDLLQSRINPHLLYNSLSVIKWNASWNKDQKTVEMIDAMTKYYRTALNKGNSIISISSELEMIKEYVKINVYAHSIGYNLEVDVEERVLVFYTLKHLLQPIVENSILHGLNGRGEGAKIMIKGYMDQSYIVFQIVDNGRGMDQETIDRILNLNYVANYGGYGIKNLIKRIQVYCGSTHGIKIESEIGVGTTVTVRIEALGENELKERMQSTREFN